MRNLLFIAALAALSFLSFAQTPVCAQTHNSTAPLTQPQKKVKVVELDSKTFDPTINASKTPVLVDFTAWWCGPCQQLAPKLEKLAGEFENKLLVTKVEVTKNPSIATRFGVRAYPTLKILAPDGSVLSTKQGNLPEADLRKWFQETIDDYEKAQKQKEKD